MNPDTIQAPLQAILLLPKQKQTNFGMLICVLAFVKAWSDSYRNPAPKMRVACAAQPGAAMKAGRQFNMPVLTMYDAFLPANVESILSEDAANAVATTLDNAIARLTLANPSLADVFQPWAFSHLQRVYTKAKAAPDTLSRVLALINQVKFEHPARSFACAEQFSNVMTALAQNSNVTARAIAPLIAQLMNLQANDVVLDMACGQGHLLVACAALLARTQPGTTLQLIGMEKDHDQWALAKMLFSLAGLPHHAIRYHNALSRGYSGLSDAEQKLTTGGADNVVMILPEQFGTWQHALALKNQDPRFKVRPPIDSRLALTWLGLNAMKPQGGRMAILMPINALSTLDGLELRQHMVEMNWLDAVITLPGIKGYVLLMLHTQRTQAPIGFIQTQCPINNYSDEGILAVRNAWQHYQTGYAHSCVLRVARTVVASNQYEFDVRGYEGAFPDSTNVNNAQILKESP